MITLIKLSALIAGVSFPCLSQDSADLYSYFKKYIGLSEKQIKAVRSGEGFAKTLSSYWAKVKFGLKPTLRIVHVVTMHGSMGSDPAYVTAQKQLYASHYFRTALDLTFCISDASDLNRPGFHLIKAMGSEQAGLTGFRGSIVRKTALNRSASSLQKSLAAIKAVLEQNLSQR
jgi:hypothetical protein